MADFRAEDLRIERKGDGTALTQADRAVEEMARAKVAARRAALGRSWRGDGRRRGGIGERFGASADDHRSDLTERKSFRGGFDVLAR